MSDQLKLVAAEAAMDFVSQGDVLGLGTGSTVDAFIRILGARKPELEGIVASSMHTKAAVEALGYEVIDLNQVASIPVYIDGTDEINANLYCLKGGGGAQTGEKIVRSVAKQFVCIADESKWVTRLGTKVPVAIEVLTMARSAVARRCVKLGGNPVYRDGFKTDAGNVILDVYDLPLSEPLKLEQRLNDIPGVVAHGLFAREAADVLLLATNQGIKKILAGE